MWLYSTPHALYLFTKMEFRRGRRTLSVQPALTSEPSSKLFKLFSQEQQSIRLSCLIEENQFCLKIETFVRFQSACKLHASGSFCEEFFDAICLSFRILQCFIDSNALLCSVSSNHRYGLSDTVAYGLSTSFYGWIRFIISFDITFRSVS